MQNKLAVLLLIIVAVLIIVEVLKPLQLEREYYDQQIESYSNGIAV